MKIHPLPRISSTRPAPRLAWLRLWLVGWMAALLTLHALAARAAAADTAPVRGGNVVVVNMGHGMILSGASHAPCRGVPV